MVIMSIKIFHGQMSNVDDQGNVEILHQETSASDVLVKTNLNTNGESDTSAIPENVTTLQSLINNLGEMAFQSDDCLLVDENSTDIDSNPNLDTEINDSLISGSLAWSSAKIASMLPELVSKAYSDILRVHALDI
jgi:hypothetical protein